MAVNISTSNTYLLSPLRARWHIRHQQESATAVGLQPIWRWCSMSGRILSSPSPLFVSMFLLGDHVSFFHLLSSVRLSWAVQCARCIRHTCPSHLHLLFFICVAKDVASVLQCSSSLVMVLGQNTPRIFRRHLFWKVSSLCASLAVSFQHSEP